MAWSTADRLRLVGKLTGIERAVVKAYRFLLALVILGILAIVALVVICRPWGAGHQGEWFYFAVAVLLALSCTIGKFVSLGRRQRASDLPIEIHSTVENGGRTWELRIGAPPDHAARHSGTESSSGQFSVSKEFRVPIASVAPEAVPDEATVLRIESELACGADLDAVCRAVQPAYADWNMLARWAYRRCVTNLLQQRRGAVDAQ